MILARVEKKPPARRRRARPHKLQSVRSQQIRRRSRDGPARALERRKIIRSPFKAPANLHKSLPARRLLNVRSENRKSLRRRLALLDHCGERIVDRFTQFPDFLQRLFRLHRMLSGARKKTARNSRIEISALPGEANQVSVALQEFCWPIGRTVIQRVNEVEAQIAGNQFEDVRSLFFDLCFTARNSPLFYDSNSLYNLQNELDKLAVTNVLYNP